MTSQPPITPGVSTEVKKVDVAIVGAGFGGLGMAIKLLEEGNRNFVILEKANEVLKKLKNSEIEARAVLIP